MRSNCDTTTTINLSMSTIFGKYLLLVDRTRKEVTVIIDNQAGKVLR